MDVIFEPQKGESFVIEVGFFDTVLEIKEKIQKYHRIPVPKQTLIFNGRILQDDRDVEFCEILQHSRIKLIVASDLDPKSAEINSNNHHQSPLPNNSNNNNNDDVDDDNNNNTNNHNHNHSKIHLNINIPSNHSHFPIQIDRNDSIRRLKERIQEIDAVGPIHRIMLQSNGSAAELQDQRSLRDCQLSDNSEVEVCLRQSPTISAAASGTTMAVASKNKLKVMVKSKCGTAKIAMEVNPMDNVGELKKELQKLHERLHFHLPQEGFFFIYDRDVMDEDRSFRWHGVGHGDTIEIFNGSVTGGS